MVTDPSPKTVSYGVTLRELSRILLSVCSQAPPPKVPLMGRYPGFLFWLCGTSQGDAKARMSRILAVQIMGAAASKVQVVGC